jgi:hypothetical protein
VGADDSQFSPLLYKPYLTHASFMYSTIISNQHLNHPFIHQPPQSTMKLSTFFARGSCPSISSTPSSPPPIAGTKLPSDEKTYVFPVRSIPLSPTLTSEPLVLSSSPFQLAYLCCRPSRLFCLLGQTSRLPCSNQHCPSLISPRQVSCLWSVHVPPKLNPRPTSFPGRVQQRLSEQRLSGLSI